ncbi:MAG: sucrase ferredoxin [Ornithinimicrobium sp.]|uniref:sucrase ferredoxin n=1 Tax=Ornithinimicrobium sp. TaxID=1977084 RepID=UPI003D9BC436
MTDLRCSDEARRRGDPLVGTAPPARRWLLLEQDMGWSSAAFDGMRLDPEVKQAVATAAAAAGARIMLIRRPGRRTSPVCLEHSWCVVDAGAADPVVWGSWSYDDDLDSAVHLLSERAGGGSAPPPVRAPAREPELLLVCTHGRHDVCCATRGRPVAAALARRWPEATWECSHTGGDRFAANVVVLPDGVAYGGLDPDSALDVVTGHHRGAPSAAHLRGVAGHPPAVQAAVVAVHEQHGPLSWGAVHPERVTTQDDVHHVVVRTPTGLLEVTVQEQVTPARQLTCRAPALGRAMVPVVSRVRTISA